MFFAALTSRLWTAPHLGHIQVDRQQRTNLPGCFAAGDCTGRPYQYVKAAGEGNVALHSAWDYLKAAGPTSK